MTKRTVTIELASGLEARPIAMLVQLASSYESTIYVQSDNKKINAKSIMGMMTLDLPVGEQVVVTADGVDEEKAVNDIEKYLHIIVAYLTMPLKHFLNLPEVSCY